MIENGREGEQRGKKRGGEWMHWNCTRRKRSHGCDRLNDRDTDRENTVRIVFVETKPCAVCYYASRNSLIKRKRQNNRSDSITNWLPVKQPLTQLTISSRIFHTALARTFIIIAENWGWNCMNSTIQQVCPRSVHSFCFTFFFFNSPIPGLF